MEISKKAKEALIKFCDSHICEECPFRLYFDTNNYTYGCKIDTPYMWDGLSYKTTKTQSAFKIGDRIECINPYTNAGSHIDLGEEGTIISIEQDEDMTLVGIEFDNAKEYRHDLAGKCEDHRGWWIIDYDVFEGNYFNITRG